MDVSEFFLKLLIILVSAKLCAEAFAFLRLPAVLGEVLAGVLIGPSVLNLISPDGTLHLLAEIGILLLLFEVGLETDVVQLVKAGGRSSLVAVTGVVVPALGGFWISSSVLGLPLIASLFIGGALVATSIGITMRVFADLKARHTRTARIVLGAAVLDDVIGVVFLAVLYDFAVSGEVRLLQAFRVLSFIALFLLLAPVITKLLVPFLSNLSGRGKTKGVMPTVVVSLILVLAVLSRKVGAPEILGSFAAGIALARGFPLPFVTATPAHFAAGIEADMKPVIDLFVPIFFVMVGVSVNLSSAVFGSAAFWKMAGLLSLVAILAKLASGVWGAGSLREKLATGIAMAPRGEVGLVFAEVGRRNGILDSMQYSVVVLVVAVTTFAAPFLLRIVLRSEPDG